MRLLRVILIGFLLCLLALPSKAVYIVYRIVDGNQNPLATHQCYVQPFTIPTPTNNSVAIGGKIGPYTTDTNGTFVQTNPIVNCVWQCTVASPPTQQPFSILLPLTLLNDTNSYYASQFLTNNPNASVYPFIIQNATANGQVPVATNTGAGFFWATVSSGAAASNILGGTNIQVVTSGGNATANLSGVVSNVSVYTNGGSLYVSNLTVAGPGTAAVFNGVSQFNSPSTFNSTLAGVGIVTETNVNNQFSGSFTGNGAGLTNVTFTNINGNIGTNLYVSPNGKDSNPGTVFLPMLTISNACTKAGGFFATTTNVYVERGAYNECDICFNGSVYFEPGSTIQFNSATTQTGAVFTDVTNLDSLASGSLTLNISGGVSTASGFAAQGGAFGYFQGINSKVHIQGNEFHDSAAAGGTYTFYMHPNVGVTLPPYNEELDVDANVIEGELWIGECSGTITAKSFFTNTFFYFDRDSTNYVKPFRVTAPSAKNCAIQAQRPFNSQAIIDIPIFQGHWQDGASTEHAMVTCVSGVLVCNNVNFIPYIVNNAVPTLTYPGGSIFVLTSAINGYTIHDVIHSSQLVLNNCTVTSTNGNTNLLFSWANQGPVSNNPTVLIGGSLYSCYCAYSNTLTVNAIAGMINTNATFLTNYFSWNP